MKSKVVGACFGTAIGDALGMPAECKKPETIQRLYGKIRGYRTPRSATDGKPFHHNLSAGMWTDDTQLMLAIGESIVEKQDIDYEDIAQKHCYAYKERRGWGKSTTRSVENLLKGCPWHLSGTKGALGNGPVMKIAPIGVLYGLGKIDDFELFRIVHNISIMTHNEPEPFVAAICQARLVGSAMHGETNFLNEWNSMISNVSNMKWLKVENLAVKLNNVYHWFVEKTSDNEVLEYCGAGPNVLESFPFTCYMVRKYYQSPRECLEKIVNMGGDADTTGAMAGSILGALHGYKAFPIRWRLGLEGKNRIMAMANGLYEYGVK